MKSELLLEKGYKKIVSMKQADDLLRRELKQLRAERQRFGSHPIGVDMEKLLDIKQGRWFKFFQNRSGIGYKKLMIYRGPVEEPKPKPKQYKNPTLKDVHTIHCCEQHKVCKYGQEDNCTVCQDIAPAEYSCNCFHM